VAPLKPFHAAYITNHACAQLRWLKRLAAYWRERGHPPGHPESRFWTEEEEALLGTASDRLVGERIGRTTGAVSSHRYSLRHRA